MGRVETEHAKPGAGFGVVSSLCLVGLGNTFEGFDNFGVWRRAYKAFEQCDVLCTACKTWDVFRKIQNAELTREVNRPQAKGQCLIMQAFVDEQLGGCFYGTCQRDVMASKGCNARPNKRYLF